MEGTIENQIVLNPPNFKEAIRNGEDFYIQFSIMSPVVEENLIKVLHRELEYFDILYMKDMLLTVLKELINNAVKANAKRLYFRKKGLDIRKKEDYRAGMETFKEEVFSNESSFLEELPEARLVVRVFFK
ncbi:MAG TPA: hypothetical protein PK875_12270, partial [Spirochaetota bacterium]|nr:hypothetical protein [Spirochaetota bacterium]